MMKEKKTLLNNNENGTGLPSKPSIMSENKLQNTVFSAIGSASPAHKLVQGSSAAAFLKNHESLLAGTAVSSAFATQKPAQGSSAAAFLKNHESLLAGTAVSSAFAKQLEKLDATEIQTLQEAAILFSRSPQGAAIIATNIHAVEVKEPDALTKLKNYIEKSPITSNFRKLPLLVQLIIIYLVTTMYSVVVDKNKELAMNLMEQAQQYVSKSISPRTHFKELTKQLPREVDISTLKHIRIITGENVRLRNTPSMQGDVLVKLEKYTPVIVIDKSDRKWLYVQLSFGEQKIYGWVNRSYTKAINH
ncbi:Uncharacterised protein [Salmonella enterica subsp. enterica serovar Typhi]|uniref:SH3 domain-containing protein n=1 Tax=Salmonella enterica TaxID=28901 RepID=UPI000631501D|nr:SH3 domain-containing protein [Salmonella enterica]CRJ88457.1 Uncharacterised protein [Salmonella enterica subsp. enterica serovar Typhi]